MKKMKITELFKQVLGTNQDATLNESQLREDHLCEKNENFKEAEVIHDLKTLTEETVSHLSEWSKFLKKITDSKTSDMPISLKSSRKLEDFQQRLRNMYGISTGALISGDFKNPQNFLKAYELCIGILKLCLVDPLRNYPAFRYISLFSFKFYIGLPDSLRILTRTFIESSTLAFYRLLNSEDDRKKLLDILFPSKSRLASLFPKDDVYHWTALHNAIKRRRSKIERENRKPMLKQQEFRRTFQRAVWLLSQHKLNFHPPILKIEKPINVKPIPNGTVGTTTDLKDRIIETSNSSYSEDESSSKKDAELFETILLKEEADKKVSAKHADSESDLSTNSSDDILLAHECNLPKTKKPRIQHPSPITESVHHFWNNLEDLELFRMITLFRDSWFDITEYQKEIGGPLLHFTSDQIAQRALFIYEIFCYGGRLNELLSYSQNWEFIHPST
ncbi:hypothetical protein SJAG_04985 [Schizosaccharomyces japonicus yFS275]|uniref:Uncharacterized protein n=1 Tax=Schizosaccharomyces japonicus (strain yFS275 / FY16936) TaxID=402676 RepID=B6K8A7_SCHJY|nr:hypothetical protein SJAG_04985 [Schizosaccharomyces japonicus yFS275]EEB09761.2 hypothetical protein SJAG_04985 [Schizosaccharomyces japonicus yFS275]